MWSGLPFNDSESYWALHRYCRLTQLIFSRFKGSNVGIALYFALKSAERVVMLKDGLAVEVRAATNPSVNNHVAKNGDGALVA